MVLTGSEHPMFGMLWSNDMKKLISERTKEAMKSPLIREKISKAKKGKKGYSHSEEEHELERINHFSQYGFKTLIIWENELKDDEKLLEKIRIFDGRCGK